MSRDTINEQLSRIVFRVPGPWKEERELKKRLPRGYCVDGEQLWTPRGCNLWLQTMPADTMFPSVFRVACRRRPLEHDGLRALDAYQMIAAVAGPAGSMNAAQKMLEASEGLIRAGGIGVFIDNSLLAHNGTDWLELIENRSDPNAVFYAYVNLVRLCGRIVSNGMHVFGQRDVVVDRDADLGSLEDFLRMACAEPPILSDGETFSDTQGKQFRVRDESGRGVFPHHRICNPFGRWRLEPC